jgi:transcription initiation factor TFIID subunit 7
MGSEAGDAPTPAAEIDDEGEEEEEGDIDEDLAAELDLALGDDEGDEEEEEEDESEEEEEEDDEDEEGGQARKLLNEEIRDLQAAVDKKDREIASSSNPLIRVRFLEPDFRSQV